MEKGQYDIELYEKSIKFSIIFINERPKQFLINRFWVFFGMQVKYDGLTGWIEFDNLSLRSNITVELLELTPRELKSFGTWTYVYGNWTDRLKIVREIKEEKHDFRANSLEGRFLKVITSLVNITKSLKSKFFLVIC